MSQSYAASPTIIISATEEAFPNKDITYDETSEDEIFTTAAASKTQSVTSYAKISVPKFKENDADIISTSSSKSNFSNSDFDPKLKPKEIAAILWNGNNRRDEVSAYLLKRHEINEAVLNEYTKYYKFEKLSLDDALRNFTTTFYLSGESQAIERALKNFSHRYQACNPTLFSHEDIVNLITNAIIMLNTDLHNANNILKMSRQTFIKNSLAALAELAVNPEKIDSDKTPFNSVPLDKNIEGMTKFLKHIYDNIKTNPLKLPLLMPSNPAYLTSNVSDVESVKTTSTMFSLFRNLSLVKRRNSNSYTINSAVTVPNPSAQRMNNENQNPIIVFEGALIRKLVLESEFKRAAKRSWREFYAVLDISSLKLYKQLNLSTNSTKGKIPPVENIIIRQCYAYKIENKRENVLAIISSYQGSLTYYQAKTPELCSLWVNHINRIAASTSSPPLPSAIGSNFGLDKKKGTFNWSRYVLSLSPSPYSIKEQYRLMKLHLKELHKEMEINAELRSQLTTDKQISNWENKTNYINHEIKRTETFIVYLEEDLTKDNEDTRTLQYDTRKFNNVDKLIMITSPSPPQFPPLMDIFKE